LGHPHLRHFFGAFEQHHSGLGKSRASDGSGTFVITNSVIRSDDLEIRAPALRMQYRGTVDFDGRTDAVVEAELLRDTWLVGPLVSRILWPITKIFEYKVTGTLSQPKLVPLFLPKILSMPLHPFRTLKELMGNPPNTNSPPATVTPPGKVLSHPPPPTSLLSLSLVRLPLCSCAGLLFS